METLLVEKRRGGRPSRRDAAAMGERILAAATELFLEHGFGATSIDALAAKLRISKRTFYHRFRGKADLFEAVVRRLIAQWGAGIDVEAPTGTLEERLCRTAHDILDVALSSDALTLYRLIVAETPRFPELARVMHAHGTGGGLARLSPLFVDAAPTPEAQRFAAEQFLSLVITVPRRRALGIGEPMTAMERETWVRATVDLFLHGIHVSSKSKRRPAR
jgi:AcrR family transcriptional regulator